MRRITVLLQAVLFTVWLTLILAVCRYQHRLLYDILMYRRPDKLVNLGNGILYINIPVMA